MVVRASGHCRHTVPRSPGVARKQVEENLAKRMWNSPLLRRGWLAMAWLGARRDDASAYPRSYLARRRRPLEHLGHWLREGVLAR